MTDEQADTGPNNTENNMTTLFTEYTDDFYSDVIDSILWNPETRDLGVSLSTNEDEIYVYSNVAPEQYVAFKNAGSKGHFYNSYIKGQYNSTVVDNDEWRYVVTPAAPAVAVAQTGKRLRVTATRTIEEVFVVTDLADLATEAANLGLTLDQITSIEVQN
jgi:hypothetical protein